MSRVALMTPDTAPLLARAYFESGQPDPITASLAQVPELLDVALPFIGAALGPSFVSGRAKEIVVLRTSADLECSYCIAAHTVAALDTGLGPAEVAALRHEADIEVFTDRRERALVDWVDALALGRGAIDPVVADAFHSHWDDAEAVELVTTVGATMWLNRYCTGLGLPTSAETAARLVAEGFAP